MEIRNAVPADEPSILAFLRRIHGEDTRLADAGLWQWHFAAAPLRTESLAYWIAYDGGAITGVLGATDVELSTPAGRRRAIWILDLVVDPGLRRRGVARGLIDASRSYCPIVLGINTARQRSTELLASMGFAIPGTLARYGRIILPGESVAEASRYAPIRSTANAFGRLFGNVPPMPASIVPVGVLDWRFDELAAERCKAKRFECIRSAKSLAWQFVDQPAKKYEILASFDNERLRGYIVLYFRRPNQYGAIEKASISDISYAGPNESEIVDDLLAAALRTAADRRAGRLSIDISDRLVEQRLAKFGFRGSAAVLQFLVWTAEPLDGIEDLGNWFLTRADSDTNILEPTNL
ncbi:MAG: GNAT family N-acetyltransferase [Acidobacteria bacterium]|nr:GNAT family N-acetyltransferase [Acidobacteriota bacterium]MCW5948708.1 GNAT family N-acetyltransferase [Pyrinomonadaceae bacterium]